ncbi:hypothetical protein B0H66DRAFT_505683 [Apodospora peruviana]|uniref:Zn(2)-C6 fungal-type domain-containing protein n=1 Tax=Apodospora peruviana TaxID=516989 RepID=A0AAE0HSQ5_9PEZI|nr:hypothetical protein B0H66DRAFT_505683 [Apodospora peruviana]
MEAIRAMDIDGLDHEIIDEDHDDGETSSVRQGESKRGRYSYLKCSACRQKKKKCEPADRVWPRRCDRCASLGLECSPPEDLRDRPPSLALPHSPRIDHGRIVKFPRPQRAPTSSASPTTTGRLSPETLGLAGSIAPPGRADHQDPPQGLCERCGLLEVSQARFLVPDRSRRGKLGRTAGLLAGIGRWASTVANPALGTLNSPPSVVRTGSRQRVPLGTFEYICTNRDTCAFCHLVWWAAADQRILAGHRYDELDRLQRRISAHATWEIDGRELVEFKNDSNFYQPVTRHIRLSWETPNSLKLNDAYIILRGDSPNPVGLDHAYLGRKIDDSPDLRETILGWIDHCDSHHAACRPDPSKIPLRNPGSFRVLDIEDPQLRLVPMNPGMDYIVLSYTWTKNEPCLKNRDVKSWYESGLKEIEPELTQDVKGAIRLVKNLRKRFLWVDSLCIIQDNDEDKDRHYPVLDRILANGSLTICAARSPDSNGKHSPALNQRIISCDRKMSLMVHHPLETYIEGSMWSEGAWTCQDRLLSGRCLIYNDSGRIWFQCQEESMSQDVFESSYQGCSADMVKSPVQIWSELRYKISQYRAYIKCVEMYTSRTLPREDHALRAFEGITHFLKAYYKTKFYSGLPSKYFDVALLWTSATSATKRRTFEGRPVAPSWSWASWTGQALYRAPVVTGAVENIHTWLREHTWITWHLVDHEGRGQLGPFTTGDLAERDDGREYSPIDEISESSDASEPELRNPKELKWPALNRITFFKSVPKPVRDPDQMDITEIRDPHQEVVKNDTRPPWRPYYLQFWTWSAYFRLGSVWADDDDNTGRPAAAVALPRNGDVKAPPPLRRYNMLDCNSDICGTIVLPDDFADKVDSDLQSFGRESTTFEFIALSDARSLRTQEMPEWTYYIPKERADSFWDLWYVLLIEKDDAAGPDVSRRVGLGKVFKDAFHQSFQPGMEWREFILS